MDSDDLGKDEDGNPLYAERWVDVSCEDVNIPTLDAEVLLANVVDLDDYIIAQGLLLV